MKRLFIIAAAIVAASPVMAQNIPPPVNTTSLGTGLTALRSAGSSLISSQAVIDLQIVPGLGGRQIIEAGTGPNGILGNNPVHLRNLGTIQGSIPQ
jgi:hypothetical protein